MDPSRRASRRLQVRLAVIALFGLGVGLVTPSAALALDGQMKLALLPVGQPGPYFDLTMKPGETKAFAVRIANDGDTAIAARTYAADVYTIINGGFGGRLRDEQRTGATGWVDYPADVLQLAPGDGTRRSFSVAVPTDASPGEYITSLFLENDRPIRDDGPVGLDEVVRQAVAIVVTVPGPRSPGLAIGAATHEIVAGTSTVQIAVENTGNVRLKPIVGFTLVDPAGAEVSHATFQMDTFYSQTKSFIEIPLATLLLPGTYDVRLTLDDAGQGARTSRGAIPLVVEARAVVLSGGGAASGIIDVLTGGGGTSLAVLGAVGVAATLLAVGGAWLVVRQRRDRRGLAR